MHSLRNSPPDSIQDSKGQTGRSQMDTLRDCLALLAGRFGMPHSGESLTHGLPLVDHRLTPSLFVRAAGRIGLSARIVQRPLADIPRMVLPAVLLLNDGNACILDTLDEDGQARLSLPEADGGIHVLPQSELEGRYSGQAIFVRPTNRFDARSRDIERVRPRRWFWDTLLTSWPIYGEVAVATLLINIFALATPLFTMNVYDRVVPNHAVETLWVLLSGVAIVYLFDLLIRALRGYFIDVAGKRADIMLSATLFERVMGIQLAQRPVSVGAFANNLQEFESLRDFFTSTTLTALIDLPFALLFILVIAFIGGPLAWVPLAFLPLALLVGYLIQRPLADTINSMFKHAAQKQATLIESLVAIESIKAFGAEGHKQRQWEDSIGTVARLGLKSRFLAGAALNVTTFLQQLAYATVIGIGVYLIAAGELTIGALIACTLLTGRAMAPLTQMVGVLTRLHQARTSFRTLDNLMNTPLERPHDKTFLHRPTIQGAVEFRDVSFRYPGQDIDVLKGVSFSIAAGERVAIVGRVGSGKTSLEKLLLGLYEPASGAILIDGTDLRQLDPIDVRRNIGYVPQDVMLFYGSLRDNIALGTHQTSDAAILHAAEIGGVTEFANTHPMGFDMVIGERGEGLSGGQRQCVAIARAMLHDPPILLFDEPTNAMDNTSEEQFKTRLAPLVTGKTLIVVTHRASLLSLVDRLIVLDGGKIAADGPRDRVLEALNAGKVKVGR